MKLRHSKKTGTTFRMIFPIQTIPTWVQEELFVYDDLHVVIIDDDYSMFKLWEEKIANTANNNVKLVYLNSPREAQQYVLRMRLIRSHMLFLVRLSLQSIRSID